ncbi:MAG: hypothetical protein K6F00_10620 [Lachnospiraceae bacterium]|nr:hypothetical protein [Lachnospiraceae bacterium]
MTEYYPAETIVEHYVKGKPFDSVVDYPRYWHGYLVILKPLLIFMEYKEIRILNGILQIALTILICVLLFKKGYKLAVVPYLLSYMMLMPAAMAKCFQFSTCFYIFNFRCLALLLSDNNEKRKRQAQVIFLYCGIMTAFFDYLTYPVSTFGIPMLFYLLLSAYDPAGSKLRDTIKNGLLWCIGYAGMWVSKWILAGIITKENIIEDGLNAVRERTSNISPYGSETYSIYGCEILNYKTFFKTPVTILVIFVIGYFIFKCIKINKKTKEYTVKLLFPFFLIGIVPAVWYVFALNHSTVHYWFTNKACIVSIMGIMLGLVCLIQSNRSEENPSQKG